MFQTLHEISKNLKKKKKETAIRFSTVTTPIYIPRNSVWGFPFPHTLTNLFICGLFDDSHANRCEVKSHSGFNLHFSDDYWCLASFHVPVGQLYVFCGKMYIQVLWPFFNWVVCVFDVELYELFIYFGY